MLTLTQLVFAHFCLAWVFASDAKPSQVHSSVNLDISIQQPGNTPAKETVAVTLLNLAGQLYKLGIATRGHWRVMEVVPAPYEIHGRSRV